MNLNYNDALILRNNGINALIQSLGEEQTRKFLALFNYYDINAESEELLVKDYTEWRRTQSFYNDPDMDEVLEHFREHPETPWRRNANGESV
ncbi:MAG: hypothetical protein LBV20_07275 [Treponema sp.]|jgi:hypothetical protein|nr:hypothetical protein [Treponema sp.]